jgi:hypothetical protein
MVFIEHKAKYFQEIEQNTNSDYFVKFLYSSVSIIISENNTIELKLLQSIEQNNVLLIQNDYNDFSEREPNSESQYLYKDLLIFLLICVSIKFQLNNTWLLRFIKLRKNVDYETELLTNTFINILNNSFENKSNCNVVIIVFKEILGIKQSDELLNTVFKEYSCKLFPFFEKQFLNILAIKSIDTIIYRKGFFDFAELTKLKMFSLSFLKRTKLIGNILLIIIYVILFSFSMFVTIKLFLGSKSEMEWADKVFTAFGAASIITIFGLIFTHKTIVNLFQIKINKLFGFIETNSDLKDDKK